MSTTDTPAAPATTDTPAATSSPDTSTTPAAADTPATTTSTTAFETSLPDGWQDHLGEEFAPHAASLQNFKDIKGLAKSYLHARASRTQLPDESSTPEQVAEWRELAGVPETPAAYELSAPEQLPEGVQWDDTRAAKLSEIAHKHHVPKAALKALAEADLQFQSELAGRAQAQIEEAKAEAKAQLVADWGSNFEANSNTVRHLASRLGESAQVPQEQLEALANNPAFNKIVLGMSKLISEDSARTPAGFGDLRSDQQRADEIMSGKDPEWGKKYMQGDRAAMDLVSQLLQKAGQA